MAPRTSTRDIWVIEGVKADELCPVHGSRRANCGCGLSRLGTNTTDEAIPDEHAARVIEQQNADRARVLAEGAAPPRCVAAFTPSAVGSFWDAIAVAQREVSSGRRTWIDFQTNEDGTITAALVMSQAASGAAA